MTRKRLLFALTAAVVIVVAAAVTVSAQNPDPPQPQTQALPEPMSEGRADLSVASSKITEAGHRMFGDRIGITWLSKADDRLYLAVRDLNDDDRDRWSRAPESREPGPTTLVDTRWSRRDLNGIQDRAIDALRNAKGAMRDGMSVGIGIVGDDVAARPMIKVSGSFSPADEEKIRAVVPVELLELEAESKTVPLVQRNVYPAYEGGKRVAWSGMSDRGCTTGFAMTHPVLGKAGTSAGHCAATGGTGNTNWAFMGTQNYPVDHQRQNHFWNSYPNTATDTNLFMLGAPSGLPAVVETDVLHRVISAAYNGFAGFGTNLCWAGAGNPASNNTKCGNVNGLDDHTSYFGHEVVQHDCLEGAAQSGDSGAPVFLRFGPQNAIAAGTSAYNRDPLSSTPQMCYSRINFTVYYTGFSVWTG